MKSEICIRLVKSCGMNEAKKPASQPASQRHPEFASQEKISKDPKWVVNTAAHFFKLHAAAVLLVLDVTVFNAVIFL